MGKEAGRLEGDRFHVSSFHSMPPLSSGLPGSLPGVRILPLPLTGDLCNLVPWLFHLLNGQRAIVTPDRHHACTLLSAEPPTKCSLM